MIHTTPGKSVVSIKGGCLTGLTKEDWANARHIWTKNAMVPIPEGVESSYEEPEEEITVENGMVKELTSCGLRIGSYGDLAG
jgi:hypothetical protein